MWNDIEHCLNVTEKLESDVYSYVRPWSKFKCAAHSLRASSSTFNYQSLPFIRSHTASLRTSINRKREMEGKVSMRTETRIGIILITYRGVVNLKGKRQSIQH